MSTHQEHIDEIVERVIEGQGDDDARLRAFCAALAGELALPTPCWVVGREGELVSVRYDGPPRRGILATVEAEGGRHAVSLVDVLLASNSRGHDILAAYRTWMGVPASQPWEGEGGPLPGATVTGELPLNMVVLTAGERSVRCRDIATSRPITFRTPEARGLVPGEILELRPRRVWSQGQSRHVSGEVVRRVIDPALLGLKPLQLSDRGPWDPDEAYWGESGDPIDPFYVPILQAGPRPSYEMEQILPRLRPGAGQQGDPILRAIGRHKAGQEGEARAILLDLAAADLRCLDAHAHLGAFAFEKHPDAALRHYMVGVRMGDLALASGFNGVLPWRYLDNRPYLRCLEGCGLSLWRNDRHDEAVELFERLLWLNPGDHQGIRFLLEQVRARARWRPGIP